MSRSARAGLTVLIVLLGSAAPARADWLLMPFAGKTFAGQTTIVELDPNAAGAKHWLIGGAAGWLTDNVLGLEVDFSWVPGVFEGANVDNLVTGSRALTLSGNFLAAVPLSVTGDSLRPYLLGGIGLVHVKANDQISLLVDPGSDIAVQLGGGAIGFLSDRAGVRFDLRQVRTLRRDNTLLGDRQPKLSFWRATIGVVIRY